MLLLLILKKHEISFLQEGSGFELVVCNLQFAKYFGSFRMCFGIFSKICESLKSELFIELAM